MGSALASGCVNHEIGRGWGSSWGAVCPVITVPTPSSKPAAAGSAVAVIPVALGRRYFRELSSDGKSEKTQTASKGDGSSRGWGTPLCLHKSSPPISWAPAAPKPPWLCHLGKKGTWWGPILPCRCSPVNGVLVQLPELPVHGEDVHVVVLLEVAGQQLHGVVAGLQALLILVDLLHLPWESHVRGRGAQKDPGGLHMGCPWVALQGCEQEIPGSTEGT